MSGRGSALNANGGGQRQRCQIALASHTRIRRQNGYSDICLGMRFTLAGRYHEIDVRFASQTGLLPVLFSHSAMDNNACREYVSFVCLCTFVASRPPRVSNQSPMHDLRLIYRADTAADQRPSLTVFTTSVVKAHVSGRKG